jgi:protein-S-isoprenylcysteine O-methyltransferase Ste14
MASAQSPMDANIARSPQNGEPTLARKFGAEYRDYRCAVRAWVPRLHP